MSKIVEQGLTISAVAARTGVSAAVLRSWEERFSFPAPARLAGGHRRYSDADVARIERVLQERSGGRSLERAIAAADQPRPTTTSFFAGLRQARPDLPVRSLSRRSMLAISLAIEEECCAQADAPVLVGAFQHRDRYEQAGARWRDLARTARAAVVFADFLRSRAVKGRPHEVAIPASSPMAREWAVVCHAGGSAGCLAGWEQMGGSRFEAVWSVDPAVVRDAAVLGLRLADGQVSRAGFATLASGLEAEVVTTDAAATVRRAEAITNRVLAHLDPS